MISKVALVRPHALPLLIFALLAGGFWLKEGRGLTPLRQGFSNEALLVLADSPDQTFGQADDYWAYKPFPYIPLHKRFLRALWNKDGSWPQRYRLWLSGVAFFTALATYLWLFLVSGNRLLSAAVCVASVVGYFESSFTFLIWGLRDINIAARQNYGVFIPVLISLYLLWANRDRMVVFFFFLLGLSANLYPAIAIASAPAFALARLYALGPSARRLSQIAAFGLAFAIGAAPVVVESVRLVHRYETAHQQDPASSALVSKMERSLPSLAADDGALDGSTPGQDPSGSWTELARWFLVYPPLLLLVGMGGVARVVRGASADARTAARLRQLEGLVVGAVVTILLGWTLKHFDLRLPGALGGGFRPLYLGNWLVWVLLGWTVVFLSSLPVELAPTDRRVRRILVGGTTVWALAAAAQLIAGLNSSAGAAGVLVPGFFLTNLMFWSLATYAYQTRGARLLHSIVGGGVIAAVAAGYSFHYGEYSVPGPLLSAKAQYLVYVAVALIPVALALASSRHQGGSWGDPWRRQAIVLICGLTVAGFSWRLPARAAANLSLVLGGRPTAFAERFTREPDFRALASWARTSTPPTSRFLILNHDGEVDGFKAFARRATPLLQGGMYEYYGDLGRAYSGRNSSLYRQALEDSDLKALGELACDLRVDYAIQDARDAEDTVEGWPPPVFTNDHFNVYSLASLRRAADCGASRHE